MFGPRFGLRSRARRYRKAGREMSANAAFCLGRRVIVVAAALAAVSLLGAGIASAAPPAPDFGSNVVVFDPSMSTSKIQATVDAIAAQQVSNQFGTQRYAL